MIARCSTMSRRSKICGYAGGMEATRSASGSGAVNGLEDGTILSLQGAAHSVFGGCRRDIQVATKMATNVGRSGRPENLRIFRDRVARIGDLSRVLTWFLA